MIYLIYGTGNAVAKYSPYLPPFYKEIINDIYEDFLINSLVNYR